MAPNEMVVEAWVVGATEAERVGEAMAAVMVMVAMVVATGAVATVDEMVQRRRWTGWRW